MSPCRAGSWVSLPSCCSSPAPTWRISSSPAPRAAAADLIESLKAGTRESGGQTSRLRAALTIGQAAVSVVLLVGAGLFVRSLVRIQSLDLGVQPERVLVTGLRYPTGASSQNPA